MCTPQDRTVAKPFTAKFGGELLRSPGLLALQILLLVPNWPRFWRRQRRSTGRRRVEELHPWGRTHASLPRRGVGDRHLPEICIQRAVDKAARRHGYLSMSALRPKADMCSALADVRFVPIADIAHPSRDSALLGGTGGLVHWLDRQNDLE